MAFKSRDSGIAASIFLSLYAIYLIFSISIIFIVGIKTRYTSLSIYGIFRFCGQMCAVVFAALGYTHWQWLVAYLVFTAEGYFMLILISFYLLGKAQSDVKGSSWISPGRKARNLAAKNATTRIQWLKAKFPLNVVFHWILIPANVLIIYGGTQLAGLTIDQIDAQHSKVETSKAFRVAGQSIFLAQSLISIGLTFYCYFVESIRHINIYTIFIIAPFLTVRGIFGILSIYVQKMNYYDFNNYTSSGLSSSFVTYEYVMATTMEFIVAVGYISNFYIKRRYYPELNNVVHPNNEPEVIADDSSVKEKEGESELEDVTIEGNNDSIQKEIV